MKGKIRWSSPHLLMSENRGIRFWSVCVLPCVCFFGHEQMWVLFNLCRTEEMWAICGGKINILPTSYQYLIHKQSIYYPFPLPSHNCPAFSPPQTHLLPTCQYFLLKFPTLSGDNVERMLIRVDHTPLTNITFLPQCPHCVHC